MKTKRQKEISKALRALAPLVSFGEAEEIKARSAARHLRHLPVSIAVWLTMIAHVRHAHTDYDAFLDEGYDRDAARYFVADQINAVLAAWKCTRRLEVSETPDEALTDPLASYPAE